MGEYLKKYTQQEMFYRKLVLFLEENGFGNNEENISELTKEIKIDKHFYSLSVIINMNSCIFINCFPQYESGFRDNSLLQISFVIAIYDSDEEVCFNFLNQLIKKIDLIIPVVQSEVKARLKFTSDIILWSCNEKYFTSRHHKSASYEFSLSRFE